MPTETSTPQGPAPNPEDVLAMMRDAGLQLTPENYHVWFEYAGGQNGALNSQIDRVRQAGQPFTREINRKIYEDFFVGPLDDDRTQREAQKKTHALLRGALDAILTSQQNAAEYQDSLSEFTGALQQLADPRDIERLVKELVRESNRMAQSSIFYQNQLEDVRAEAEKLSDELDNALRHSSIDPLTGLHNRKAVDEKIEELIAEFTEEGKPFAVVMIDVDHFRDFNTKYGHQIGDAVLRVVSTTLKDHLKGTDFVARYGGEEFILFFPNTRLQDAAMVTDKLRAEIETHRKRISKTGEELEPITISCGVSECHADDTAESVIHRADQALYHAKHSGRNRVKTEEDLEETNA